MGNYDVSDGKGEIVTPAVNITVHQVTILSIDIDEPTGTTSLIPFEITAADT